jgi:DNA modification methylase
VLDPFLGLGSSAVAAAQLGLDFIGIEMDEQYLQEAVQRVEASLETAEAGKVDNARGPASLCGKPGPSLF